MYSTTKANTPSLTAVEVASVPADMVEPLLAYLNLPPVGCIDDVAGVPVPGNDASYELPARLRTPLARRRSEVGGRFTSLGELVDVEGLSPADLGDMVERLADVERYGNRGRPVWGGPEAHREFFALLESAQRYIHISTYIIGGEAGLRLARLLARKKREGVEVRVMFCASGFVISGSPSGTGFVSRFSEMRSHLLNDRYVRKRIIDEMHQTGVRLVNTAPIGRHWRRRDMRAAGIDTAERYYRWAREREIPEEWLDEQRLIDQECAVGFANVDHRKMVIVDGDKAFVGSQNLGDAYLFENELDPDPAVNWRNWQWHDTSTILEGGCVRELNRLFARRWWLSGGDRFAYDDATYAPPPVRAGHAAVMIETTIPGMVRTPLEENWRGFLQTLVGANKRPVTRGFNAIRERLRVLPALAQTDCYIEHCYPADSEMLEHWSRHASSLEDFHMIVPLHYDTQLTGGECDRNFPQLLAAGATLHGYARAIMHSKTAVMDGFYTVTGSYNANVRSSRSDLENEFFIQCSELGQATRARMRGDMELCEPVVPSMVDRYRAKRSVPVLDALLRYLIM